MELQEPKLSNLLEGLKFMEEHYKQDYEKTLSVNHPYTFFLTFREQTEDLLKKGYEIKKSEPTLEEAIKVLQKHLREDKHHFFIMDILRNSIIEHQKTVKNFITSEDDLFSICNKFAKNFLDLLIKE